MKKTKILFVYLLTLFFLHNCGYKPIYSSDRLNLKLDIIDFESNKLNNQIFRSLKAFSNPQGSEYYQINFNTKKERRIASKNAKGDTETYELKIILNMTIISKQKELTKNFINKIIYNNNDNTFELKQYEREIEKQIITDLTEEIIIFFSEI